MMLALTLEVSWLKIAGAVLGCAYIIALIIYLARSYPHAEDLPDFAPLVRLKLSFRQMLALTILIVSVVFVLTGVLMQNGWFMVFFSVLLALGLLVRYRSQITRQMVFGGILISVAIALVETLMDSDLMMALLIIPLSVSGLLLLEHTQLTRFHCLDRRWGQAVRSFGWGCVLAVPPALLNIVLSQSAAEAAFDLQFEHWWQAFYALQPGIVEEVWARLFLTTLFYALLRPTCEQEPRRALVAAMGLATILHGLAHYPYSLSDPISAVFSALLYGVPLVLLYVKRDFEHAVAYHFFIDFVRFLV